MSVFTCEQGTWGCLNDESIMEDVGLDQWFSTCKKWKKCKSPKTKQDECDE